MERSEPTLVLPIVHQALSETSAAAPIGNPCKTRRNKIMLPKASHSKALGGSSLELPPRDAIFANAILTQKAPGGSSLELPPRYAIFANATLTQKPLGCSS